MNLRAVPLKELEREIKRRKAETLSQEIAVHVASIVAIRPPKRERILAGENLIKGTMVVVDTEGKAFAYPETPIIPGERRIAGYAICDVRKGRRLRLRHWCFEGLIVG